jgi:hypothetical protein
MLKRLLTFLLIFLCSNLSMSAKDSGLSSVSEQWELRGKIAASKLNDLIIELESLKMPHKDREQDEGAIGRITDHTGQTLTSD